MNSFPDSADSKVPSMLGSSTISQSSSEPDTLDKDGDGDGEGDGDGDGVELTSSTIAAALAAAAWISRGSKDSGRGSKAESWGKLRTAELPLMLIAATSWARAAISGVENVPSQMRDFLRGSRISDTHLPQFRIRTPR